GPAAPEPHPPADRAGGQRPPEPGRRPGCPQRRIQKERTTTKAPFPALIASIAACILSLAAQAAAAQGAPAPAQDEPDTVILSDTLHYDDVNKTSTFTGNVVLTRGSMTLRGDKLVTREDAQGNQFGTATP